MNSIFEPVPLETMVAEWLCLGPILRGRSTWEGRGGEGRGGEGRGGEGRGGEGRGGEGRGGEGREPGEGRLDYDGTCYCTLGKYMRNVIVTVFWKSYHVRTCTCRLDSMNKCSLFKAGGDGL